MKLDDFKRTSFVFHYIYVPRSSQVLGDTSKCVHFRGLVTGGVKNHFMKERKSRERGVPTFPPFLSGVDGGKEYDSSNSPRCTLTSSLVQARVCGIKTGKL